MTESEPTFAQSAWALAAIIAAVLVVCVGVGWMASAVVNGLSFTDAHMTWRDGFGLALMTWITSRLWHWGNG